MLQSVKLLPLMAENPIARQTATRERVATNLKLFRGKQSMSQEALADRAGLHRTQISLIERGRASVTLDTLVALASALGVTEVDLLTAHDELPTPLKSGPKSEAERAAASKPRRKHV
ncbi:helix-turn-helix transcriptional regulator [Paraburkholderia nemoris]|uniref:helix-turn-helix domain-containing protein n=1 Tax=Paraburkholderia nemoris TaxID=2793076 RepID=UPI0038B797CC